MRSVSPGRVRIGGFLISWDDLNNYSTRLKPVICSLLMTLAKSSKNAVLALGNPCSIRWTTGTEIYAGRINGLNGDGQDTWRYGSDLLKATFALDYRQVT